MGGSASRISSALLANPLHLSPASSAVRRLALLQNGSDHAFHQ